MQDVLCIVYILVVRSGVMSAFLSVHSLWYTTMQMCVSFQTVYVVQSLHVCSIVTMTMTT